MTKVNRKPKPEKMRKSNDKWPSRNHFSYCTSEMTSEINNKRWSVSTLSPAVFFFIKFILLNNQSYVLCYLTCVFFNFLTCLRFNFSGDWLRILAFRYHYVNKWYKIYKTQCRNGYLLALLYVFFELASFVSNKFWAIYYWKKKNLSVFLLSITRDKKNKARFGEEKDLFLSKIILPNI